MADLSQNGGDFPKNMMNTREEKYSNQRDAIIRVLNPHKQRGDTRSKVNKGGYTVASSSQSVRKEVLNPLGDPSIKSGLESTWEIFFRRSRSPKE